MTIGADRKAKGRTNQVLVDVDGVLAKYEGFKGVDKIGDPIGGAREFLHALRDKGFRIVIFTTRCCRSMHKPTPRKELVEHVRSWLDKHDLFYDDIWSGHGKPHCVAIVDDRGVHCDPQRYGTRAFLHALEQVQVLATRKRAV